jgi:EAL domain-containing protein (putative c-di-GMP-specific phosphodiesterase class I)/ActR/RegA family two-component response regulator
VDEIRVVVADDDNAVVDVLRALIQSQDDLRFVGSANDTESAIALAVKERPDVALVDVRMPGGGGVRAAREITRRCPPTKVIALTAHEDQETVIAMMAAGANAYIPKGESTERILREIHRPVRVSSVTPEEDLGVWTSERRPAARKPGERRHEQQRRIREVLDSGAVNANFRPILEIETSAVVGIEACTRVARLPMRTADAWLAEAEAVGMLVPFELAVLRAAIRDAGLTPASAFIVVHVSPTTVIEPAFEEAVLAAGPERIVLDLTERAPVEDYQPLNDALAWLRDEGVRLEVSDVGAGLSSLRHVAMLAPDLLKIDTALTDDVDVDQARHAVVAALSSRAGQLGARAVADHVTSIAQAEELAKLGVGLLQGPLLELLGRGDRSRPTAFSSSGPDADSSNRDANSPETRSWRSTP